MNSEDRVEALRTASKQYQQTSSSFYDQVVNEVASRAEHAGSIGKADIGALVIWKRLNASTPWAARLMNTPEATVREATARAREAALATAVGIQESACAARSALATIPGLRVGDALASAVIFALAPTRMAVYDRRAQKGIELLGLPLTAKSGRYGRYMVIVEQLRTESKDLGFDFSPREIDLALFTLGGRVVGQQRRS